MPATNVPWPRPSPDELFGSVLRLTDASSREPKSARFSTPESTIAIVGRFAAMVAFWSPSQLFETPLSYGQSWFDVHFALPLVVAVVLEVVELIVPLTATGASGVIAFRPSLPCAEICVSW